MPQALGASGMVVELGYAFLLKNPTGGRDFGGTG